MSENETKAKAVMDFVNVIRGAYSAGFIDNNPTNYDIYRSAQVHVKDRYGVDTENWDDDLAKESRECSDRNKLTNFLKQCASFADSQDAFDSCALNGIAINAKALLDEMREEQ